MFAHLSANFSETISGNFTSYQQKCRGRSGAGTGTVTFDRPGTAAQNILVGPGFSNLDAVLFKNFHLSKRVTASIRVQCYNITSTPPFGHPIRISAT
jgi:hypothetical protein